MRARWFCVSCDNKVFKEHTLPNPKKQTKRCSWWGNHTSISHWLLKIKMNTCGMHTVLLICRWNLKHHEMPLFQSLPQIPRNQNVSLVCRHLACKPWQPSHHLGWMKMMICNPRKFPARWNHLLQIDETCPCKKLQVSSFLTMIKVLLDFFSIVFLTINQTCVFKFS